MSEPYRIAGEIASYPPMREPRKPWSWWVLPLIFTLTTPPILGALEEAHDRLPLANVWTGCFASVLAVGICSAFYLIIRALS